SSTKPSWPVPMHVACSTSRAIVRSAACVPRSTTRWVWMRSRRWSPTWPSSRRSTPEMSDADQLKVLRVRIDSLDEKILELISDRARCAQEVARVKMLNLQPGETPVFYRPEREA